MDVNIETHIKGPPHIGVEIHKSDTLRWTGSIHSVNLGHQNREAVEHNIPSWQQVIINVIHGKKIINKLLETKEHCNAIPNSNRCPHIQGFYVIRLKCGYSS